MTYREDFDAALAQLAAYRPEVQDGEDFIIWARHIEGVYNALDIVPNILDELYPIPSDHVRFVRRPAEGGSDVDGDGLTPATAFATVGAAVASLPEREGTYDGVTNYFRTGQVIVGRGTFLESEPIQAGPWLQIWGSGVGYDGTVIAPADGMNDWLFDLDPSFTEFPHFFQLRDLTLDGRSETNPTSPGLLRTRNGGFNWACINVFFRNSAGVGTDISGYGANFLFSNCVWINCNGGFMKWTVDTDACHISLNGTTQVDSCGPSALQIIQTVDAGSHNTFEVSGILKTEVLSTDPSNFHKYVIDITPRPSPSVGDRLHVLIDRIVSSRNANPGEAGSRVIYERDHDNNPGTSGVRLDVASITAPEYERCAESALQGYITRGREAWNVRWSGGWGKSSGDIGIMGGLVAVETNDGVERFVATDSAPSEGTFPNGTEWLNKTTGVLQRRENGSWVTK